MQPEIVLLTGAASGIGGHFARALLQRGNQYRLALADINEAGLRAAFQSDDRVQRHRLDVRSVEQWQHVIAQTQQQFGRIDYLFNIAGVVQPGFLLDAPVAEIDRHLDINARGVMYGTRLVAEVMAQQGAGHIINVASLAGIAPVPGIELYVASKFAVRGFSLAAAAGLREKGICLTVVCPGLVDTPMLDLQLNYREESSMVFSGPAPLTVTDIERALFRAMRDRPLELIIPASRGWLSKLGNVFPNFMPMIFARLRAQGQKNIEQLRRQRPGKWQKPTRS